MIWLISDTHFNHAKSLTWDFPHSGERQRPFDSVEEMNERMFDNWNDMVKPHDTVYHLGDVYWSRCPAELKLLPGKKRLIAGNHDNLKDHDLFDVFEKIYVSRTMEIEGETVLLSHYPVVMDNEWRAKKNIHGHVHGNVLEVSPNHRNVCVELTGFAPILLQE